jgi:hypothetical protein
MAYLGRGAFLAIVLASLIGNLSGINGLFAITGGIMISGAVCRWTMSSRPGMSWDERILTVNRSWSTIRLPWRDIEKVGMRKVTQRVWFVIPVSSHLELFIVTKGLIMGHRTLRIPMLYLSPGDDGLRSLDQAFNDSRAAAAKGDRFGFGPATAPPRVEVDEVGGTGFDADAVFARYMAKRDALPGSPASASPQPAAAPTAPARPQFGRRTA